MKASVNLKPALVFLDDLATNNNKAWFDAHRPRYEEAKAQFEEFVQLLIAEIDKFDALGILSAKECIFRINRDVRFSKINRRTKRTWAHTSLRAAKKAHGKVIIFTFNRTINRSSRADCICPLQNSWRNFVKQLTAMPRRSRKSFGQKNS